MTIQMIISNDYYYPKSVGENAFQICETTRQQRKVGSGLENFITYDNQVVVNATRVRALASATE